MANLSKQQVKVILDSAPKSMDRGKIVEFLVENGNILEGYNDQPAPIPEQSGGIFGPAKEAFGGLTQMYGGGEHGIAQTLKRDITQGADSIQQGDVLGSTKAGFRVAGDVAGAVYAPIGAAIGATGLNKVFDFIGSHYDDVLRKITGSGLSDIPEFQQFAMDNPNAGEDFGRALNLTLSKYDAGQIKPETIIPRTIAQVKAIPSNVQGATTNISNKMSPLIEKIQMPQDTTGGSKGARIIDTAMRDTVSKYTVATDILQNAEGKFGTDPIGVIKNYGNKAIPTMENGRMNSGESIDFLKKQIGELSNLKNDAVFLNDNVVSFNEFRKQAISQAMAEGNRSGWTKMQQDIVAKDVNKIVDALEQSYKGKDLPMNEFDKIKTEQTGLSKTYKNPNNKFSYDAHSIIGKTSRSLVETFTQDAPTKELNKLIQSHYDAIDLLDALQGKTPFGGMMTKNFNRLAGEIVGATAGSAVGHPIIGAFAGRQLADIMGGILQSDLISNPLKKMIVDNMQGVEPAVKKQMMQYIDENSPDITELGNQQLKDKQNIPKTKPKLPLKGKGEIPPTNPTTSEIGKRALELTKKNGGVTINLKGDIPTEGFAYSPFKDVERVVPLKGIKDRNVNDFIDEYFDKISEEGNHLGIWIDNGKVYMDISKVNPNESLAATNALANKQIALFDLKTFETKNIKDYEKIGDTYAYKGQNKGGVQKGSSGATSEEGNTQVGQVKITDSTKFERAQDLSPRLRALESKAFDYVLKNEDAILEAYTKKFGKRVNADDFRPFLRDAGYSSGTLSAGVQEPVSYLAKRQRTIQLQNEGDFVVAMAGGSGVGKSSGVGIERIMKLHDSSAMVLDSNFSSLESAKKFIEEVSASKKDFIGVFTYRDFLDSIENGIIQRMLHNVEEMGRVVPNKIAAKNHPGSWEVVGKLFDEGYHFYFVDNSLGRGKAKLVSLNELESKIKYAPYEQLLKEANAKVKELYESHTPFIDPKTKKAHYITKEQYNALVE